MQKEIVLLATYSHKSIREKVLFLHLTLLYLYKTTKPLGCPPVTFGLAQPFNPTILSFSECCTIRYIKLKFNSTFIKRDQFGRWWTFPKPRPLLLLICWDLRPSLSSSLSSSLLLHFFLFLHCCLLSSSLSSRHIFFVAAITLSWK